MRVLAALVVSLAVAGSASGVYAATAGSRSTGAATAEAASGNWSVLGEYRVSPRPTSLSTRSREPIVAADPIDAARLAVVYVQGAGAGSQQSVIRISHDRGATWRTALGHPRGGGSHPMIAWGPGPRSGTARLYYGAMGGP